MSTDATDDYCDTTDYYNTRAWEIEHKLQTGYYHSDKWEEDIQWLLSFIKAIQKDAIRIGLKALALEGELKQLKEAAK